MATPALTLMLDPYSTTANSLLATSAAASVLPGTKAAGPELFAGDTLPLALGFSPELPTGGTTTIRVRGKSFAAGTGEILFDTGVLTLSGIHYAGTLDLNTAEIHGLMIGQTAAVSITAEAEITTDGEVRSLQFPVSILPTVGTGAVLPFTPILEITVDGLTLDDDHVSRYLRFTNVADITVTIDDEAATPIPIGSVIQLFRAIGAGTLTISPHENVTLNTTNPVIAWDEATVLIKVGANEWDQL